MIPGLLDKRVALGLFFALFVVLQFVLAAHYGILNRPETTERPCDGGRPTSSNACFR